MRNVLKYDVIRPKGISIKLPLIMLHGFFGCKSNLRHIANSKLINTDRTCYLLDLRNHGDSFHQSDMHFKSMVEDILHFMSMIGIQKPPIWLGHSYGAKMGYYAALKYSNHVGSVIALDIAPVSYESEIPKFQSLLQLFKTMESMQWAHRKDVEQFIASQMPSLSHKEVMYLTKPFVAVDENSDHNTRREWHWKSNVDAMISEMNNIVDFPVDHKALFDGPCYLFRGSGSKWASLEREDAIYNHFPNMKITTIADAGHNVHVDQPEETIRHIASALDEIDIDFNEAHGPAWNQILESQSAWHN